MKQKLFFILLCIPIFLVGGESGYIDKTHKLLSDWIYDTSNKIDTFFARKDFRYKVKNSSYINLSFDSFFEEHRSLSYKLNARVRVKLPRTQKSLHLIFEDYKNSISADQQTSSNINDTIKDNSYILGLELNKMDTKFINLNFGSGIHFSGISPEGYVSLYFSKRDYISKWVLSASNSAKYFTKKHFDNTFEIMLYKVIGDNYKFTLLNSFHYQERDKQNEIINALILDRYINHKEGIGGSFSLYSSANSIDDIKLRYYLTKVTYKRFFYHNFAYYQLSPGVIFRDENSFKPSFRVVFKMGIYFSKFSLGGYKRF